MSTQSTPRHYTTNDPADLAHDARNALAGALGRVQLLLRQAERGPVNPDRVSAGLREAEERLRRAVALVDALEVAAEAAINPQEEARAA